MNDLERNILVQIMDFSKKIYDQMNRIHHNWDHIMRDYRRAEIICAEEKANDFVVLSAITMHDLGYLFGPEGHALSGARACRENILPEYNLPKPIIEKICHCIEAHDPDSGVLPQTIEAKIVADADLLEKSDLMVIMEGLFNNVAREFNITYRDYIRLFLRKMKPNFYTKKAEEMDNGRLELIRKLFEKA